MTDSNRLTSGEVDIILAGETVTLRPTLGAALAVSRRFGGFRPAFERAFANDLEAVAEVVAAGTGQKLDDVLMKRVWRDLDAILPGVFDFLAILRNGGRRPDPETSPEVPPVAAA